MKSAWAGLALVLSMLGCTAELESPEPAEPRSKRMPLVLAVDPRSELVDVSLVEAERLIAQGEVAALPAAEIGPDRRALTVDGIDPLREPRRYPLLVEGPAPGKITTLIALGDVMLGRRVGERMVAAGDFALPFKRSAKRLGRADLVFANFESTLSRNGRPTQDDAFAADPRALNGLREANVSLVSLANNHSGDFGPRALIETLEHFRDAGIATVGAGAGATDARRPAIVERNGVRFGFLAFNAIGETPAAGADTPGAVQIRMQPRTGPLDRGDLTAFARRVRTLRQRTDVVIVYAHWGANYTHDVHPDQRRVARVLADAGATVVLGTHPHWVQGIEVRDRVPIAYSLGNFVFDMDFSSKTRQGIALELVFWDAELKAVTPRPIHIDDEFAPRFVPGREILRDWWASSGPPFNRGA